MMRYEHMRVSRGVFRALPTRDNPITLCVARGMPKGLGNHFTVALGDVYFRSAKVSNDDAYMRLWLVKGKRWVYVCINLTVNSER
jgi:hypothetical protein